MHEYGNCTEVAKIIKMSRRSIQLWVDDFNEDGMEEIALNPPPGHHPHHPPEPFGGAERTVKNKTS